jgi:dTDP-4-dehydrorhamnose 3,5-epimerase-like enzyme
MRIAAKRQIIKILPGIAHSVWNPSSEVRTLMYAVTYFFRNGENELRLPFDYLGEDFFKIEPS